MNTPKTDERPQRLGWAPGKYLCMCRECSISFIGDKRATMCANCAYATPDSNIRTMERAQYIESLKLDLAEAMRRLSAVQMRAISLDWPQVGQWAGEANLLIAQTAAQVLVAQGEEV